MSQLTIKIVGRFQDLSEDACPARWRRSRCKNPPTQWVVFWIEDDQELDQLNTCLGRYCKLCFDTKPPKPRGSSTPDWVALSNQDAADLLEEAKVYEVQEQ